jgi:hypothetical protein
VALLACLTLSSCGEAPAPGPVSTKDVRIRKLVVFANNNEMIEGHFSLENEEKKQLALSGRLTLICFLASKVSVEKQPAFDVKAEIYRGGSEIKVGDFQWIYYHSFLTEDDFVCKFRLPFNKFKSAPPAGRYIGFKLEFKPDVYPLTLEAERQVWIPN